MLSHLRFHRRGASNPTSPAPDQASPSPLSSHQSTFTPNTASPLDEQLTSAGSSSLPPTLPPITRVTSTELDLRSDERSDVEKATKLENRSHQVSRYPYTTETGFIGGVALRNYQRDVEAQQAAGRADVVDNIKSGGSVDDHARNQYPKPVSINTDLPSRPPPPQILNSAKSTASFSSPTNMQGPSSAAPSSRPSGSRLISEPPPSSSIITPIEPQKGKKGLPFLKNPMSTLLLRRKANQNTPSIPPLPLSSRSEEPTYDPRIKGTRVHDFSAPRRRHNIPTSDTVAIRSASRTNLSTEPGNRQSPVADGGDNILPGEQQRRHLSNASDPARPESVSTASQPIAQSSSVSSIGTKSSSVEQALPSDDQLAPPVPPKDDIAMSMQLATSGASEDTEILPKTAGSVRTSRSRNVSLSSIPKHMKSTSSRFSFDMIGAAKQEKLLEERHRQRELDKKAAVKESRDSRFDDFDEDTFDYDAMMDDDGLEEKIPGINADFDVEDQFVDDQYLDDEEDPDNDQENFAGFVFQRSNPVSSVTSPRSGGTIATPRDAEGKVIGFAMTKDTPNLPNFPLSPGPNALSWNNGLGGQVSGLGIQGMCISDTSKATETKDNPIPQSTSSPPSATAPRAMGDDDLYFDDGMAGFGNVFAEDLAAEPEGDGVPFDESIFDNDDTDQFGRPVPGAFAMAQSLRQTSKRESVRRESDMTSRFSAQSRVSQSTAHTSLSIDAQQSTSEEAVKATHLSPPLNGNSVVAPQPTKLSEDAVATYQAALAAAAHKAAASGKFERSLSPLQDEMDNQAESSERLQDSELHDGDYDDYAYSYDDMDDFELDDDAIIAEANASALANDSDGWYGQEFGFYAAPTNHHGSYNSGSGLEGYGYANGGFFGPKGANGLNRSTSGRVVSREPNLTPITERSEYSNRNSILSLGIPPISGTPTIQSPGLAQLAMMADRGDDQMTLSALLRLRTKAWGGSQASLASSKDGSPRSERGETPGSPRTSNFPGALPNATTGHTRKNSVFSIMSRDSDVGSSPGSPTLTFAMPIIANGAQCEAAAVDHDASRSCGDVVSTSGLRQIQTANLSATDMHDVPLSAVSGKSSNGFSGVQDGDNGTPSFPRSTKGHQRQKGSADSISYMKEEDSGETRWVMERRRTGESGQVEILEREIVEGGRI